MFTGLIETTGSVLRLETRGESARLELETPADFAGELALGESVAVNGCCLTVTGVEAGCRVSFDLLAQTLRVTSLGDRGVGSLVNLGGAMGVGDRFGGHFVQGHVDATVRVTDWSAVGQDHRLEVDLSGVEDAVVLAKGSICLDGISLTAAEVGNGRVVCWIIPHTLERTHLRGMEIGRRMNVEFDMLGKYVRELMRQSSS